MKRNDDWVPEPNENQTLLEQSFSIFVQRAAREHRSYFGDMVKENLGTYLQNGCSPQQSVDELFKRVQNEANRAKLICAFNQSPR